MLCECLIIINREAYRRLQNEGKISKLPDRAYLFSPNNQVPSGDGLEGLFDYDSALEVEGTEGANNVNVGEDQEEER